MHKLLTNSVLQNRWKNKDWQTHSREDFRCRRKKSAQSYAGLSISTYKTHIQIALNYECSCVSAAWLWYDVMISVACARVTPKHFLVQLHMWPCDCSSGPQRQSHALRLSIFFGQQDNSFYTDNKAIFFSFLT